MAISRSKFNLTLELGATGPTTQQLVSLETFDHVDDHHHCDLSLIIDQFRFGIQPLPNP